MTENHDEDAVVLRLTRNDAAIVVAALRQYEPYWSPEDADRKAELSALVADIMRMLSKLRGEATSPLPGLLGSFQHG